MSQKNAKKKKRRVFTVHHFVFLAFLGVAGAFLFTRLGLNSYNMELSQANHALTREITRTQQDISQLETEINLLQEKSQILDILNNQLVDNYSNIYVIEEETN